MTKKTSKREKGITLIALIVTIIVLLILAGVTISLVVGNQGIIGKTKDATSKYSQRQAEEQVAILMQEYAMENAEKGTKLEDFLKEKKEDGTITDYKANNDGTATISKDGYNVTVNDNGVTGSTKVADSGNKGTTGGSSGSESGGGTSGSGSSGSGTASSGSITYTDSDNKTQTLTKDTAAGTKIGTTTFKNSDATDAEDITLDWYLFDVSDDGKTAYLVSTPTCWVPDTTKEVRGAWAPKLVSAEDNNTHAMRQAIQKLANGTDSYSSGSVTYKPTDSAFKYYKSANSLWSAQRGNIDLTKDGFKTYLKENEQAACYLADEDIFKGIKDQVNNADGNLKGKIQTLVGGASAEQWCKAYNKQTAASSSKITCEYQATDTPGYIYKVNGTAQNSGWWTNTDTIFGNDIYGAAHKNGNPSSSNPFYYSSGSGWWLASPSAAPGSDKNVCYVYGISSYLDKFGSYAPSYRVSLFASVAL